MIPRNQYTSVELRWGIVEWNELATRFIYTFYFLDDHPSMDYTLQLIKTNIIKDISVTMTKFNQNSVTIQHWMECYNVRRELDDDDPHDINIPESEGTHAVEGSGVSSDKFLNPLKIKKENIGSSQNPKFANIRYYWDDETIRKITDLLNEFQDLFPTKFSEMKRIVGDLGEMIILLKADAKPVKQRLYQFNPRYKEKFKT